MQNMTKMLVVSLVALSGLGLGGSASYAEETTITNTPVLSAAEQRRSNYEAQVQTLKTQTDVAGKTLSGSEVAGMKKQLRLEYERNEQVLGREEQHALQHEQELVRRQQRAEQYAEQEFTSEQDRMRRVDQLRQEATDDLKTRVATTAALESLGGSSSFPEYQAKLDALRALNEVTGRPLTGGQFAEVRKALRLDYEASEQADRMAWQHQDQMLRQAENTADYAAAKKASEQSRANLAARRDAGGSLQGKYPRYSGTGFERQQISPPGGQTSANVNRVAP